MNKKLNNNNPLGSNDNTAKQCDVIAMNSKTNNNLYGLGHVGIKEVSIDKISLIGDMIYNFDTCNNPFELKDNALAAAYSIGKNDKKSYHVSKDTNYKYKINIKDHEGKFTGTVFYIGTKHPKQRFTKIEYNPNRFKKAEVKEAVLSNLSLLLQTCLGLSFKEYLYFSTCTKLDVAIDITGTHPDLFSFENAYTSKVQTWMKKGVLQTINFGDRAKAGYRIYDKTQEQKDKGVVSEDSTEVLMRIEKIASPNVLVKDMKGIKNPFSTLKIRYPAENYETQSKFENDILHLLKVAGNTQDFKKLKKQMKSKEVNSAIKDLEGYSVGWWKPDDIWNTHWLSAIEKAGLNIIEPYFDPAQIVVCKHNLTLDKLLSYQAQSMSN